jgi:DNA-binding transcriptional regulator YdaS (Cro superfamily)
MDLKEYLDRKVRSGVVTCASELARDILFISKAALSSYLNGKRYPSLKMALHLEKVTKGSVTGADLDKYFRKMNEK